MDINKTFKEIAQFRNIIAEAEKELKPLEDMVKAYMTENNCEELLSDEHKALYKEITSNRFDSTAFKKDYAELYEAYKKVTKSMRFTFA